MSDTPESGKPFNGYKRLHNILIPISLAKTGTLSWFDKVLYGRLRFEAGNSDRCRIRSGGLAKELAVSDETVKRSLDRMVEEKLIVKTRQQRGILIVFIWSPILRNSLPKSARSDSAPERIQDRGSESAQKRNQENPESANASVLNPQTCGSDSAPERISYKEDLGFSLRIKEESSSGSDFPTASECSDDDLLQSKIKSKISDCFKARNCTEPRGKNPSGEFVALLRNAGAQVDDLDAFFDHYFGKLKDPPAVWKHTVVALGSWLNDPSVKTEIEAQRSARERKRVTQTKLETAVPFDDALYFLDTELYFDIPRVRAERLRRRNPGLIRPIDLQAQARAFPNTACSQCKDNGLIGSAARRSLHFCDCPAGVEDKQVMGEDFIAKEIATVNAMLQSRLAALLLEAGDRFAADFVTGGRYVIVTEREETVLIEYDSDETRLFDLVKTIKRAYRDLDDPRPLTIEPTGRLKAALDQEEHDKQELEAKFAALPKRPSAAEIFKRRVS